MYGSPAPSRSDDSLGRTIENDVHLLERNQPAANHFVQPGKHLFYPLSVLNGLNNNRQVLREAQDVSGVIEAAAAAAGPIPSHSAQNRNAGKPFASEHLYDRLIQRLVFPSIRLADMDPHQGLFTFESLVLHSVLL